MPDPYMGSVLHAPENPEDIFCLMIPLTFDLVRCMISLGEAFKGARSDHPLTDSMSWDISDFVDFNRVHVLHVNGLPETSAGNLVTSLMSSGVAVMNPDRQTLEIISERDPFDAMDISRVLMEVSGKGCGEQVNIHIIGSMGDLQSIIYPLDARDLDETSGLPKFTVAKLAGNLSRHVADDRLVC